LNSSDIKLVVFDLDGTLVDSAKTIYDATIAALSNLGISHSLTREILDARIGAHFQDIFDELGIVVDDFEGFIDVYKGYYFEFIDGSYLYPGVTELLELLKRKDISVSLLTTKAQEQADKIITHFNLDRYFDFIMGRRNGIAVKPAPDPLIFVCESLGIERKYALMVGDTELDVQCGIAAGVRTAAISHGYRSPESLTKEKPDVIVGDLYELLKIFSG